MCLDVILLVLQSSINNECLTIGRVKKIGQRIAFRGSSTCEAARKGGGEKEENPVLLGLAHTQADGEVLAGRQS